MRGIDALKNGSVPILRIPVSITIQCNAVQCSAVQCNAVQCSTVQYSTIPFISNVEKQILTTINFVHKIGMIGKGVDRRIILSWSTPNID